MKSTMNKSRSDSLLQQLSCKHGGTRRLVGKVIAINLADEQNHVSSLFLDLDDSDDDSSSCDLNACWDCFDREDDVAPSFSSPMISAFRKDESSVLDNGPFKPDRRSSQIKIAYPVTTIMPPVLRREESTGSDTSPRLPQRSLATKRRPLRKAGSNVSDTTPSLPKRQRSCDQSLVTMNNHSNAVRLQHEFLRRTVQGAIKR